MQMIFTESHSTSVFFYIDVVCGRFKYLIIFLQKNSLFYT